MITFDLLNGYWAIIKHGFTTRDGGYSENEFASLNLGFRTGDDIANVIKNYGVLAKDLEIDVDSFVFAGQVHGDKIMEVDWKHKAKGLVNSKFLEGIDAMITNMPGITLTTVHADCAPVYLLDVEGRSIGLAHSGWRGTLKRIAGKTALAMRDRYRVEPSALIAVIGPSNCANCFETSHDFYKSFASEFAEMDIFSEITADSIKIDLKGIIKHDLLETGLMPENIHVSDLCTKCREDLFYSYRRSNGATGRMAAVLQLL
jgi:YfiH family protein